jgi:hypothetical protein
MISGCDSLYYISSILYYHYHLHFSLPIIAFRICSLSIPSFKSPNRLLMHWMVLQAICTCSLHSRSLLGKSHSKWHFINDGIVLHTTDLTEIFCSAKRFCVVLSREVRWNMPIGLQLWIAFPFPHKCKISPAGLVPHSCILAQGEEHFACFLGPIQLEASLYTADISKSKPKVSVVIWSSEPHLVSCCFFLRRGVVCWEQEDGSPFVAVYAILIHVQRPLKTNCNSFRSLCKWIRPDSKLPSADRDHLTHAYVYFLLKISSFVRAGRLRGRISSPVRVISSGPALRSASLLYRVYQNLFAGAWSWFLTSCYVEMKKTWSVHTQKNAIFWDVTPCGFCI